MSAIMDSLTWASGAEKDFRIEGATSVAVSSGSTAGFRVTLALSGNATTATGISYLGHQNTPEPMVTNRNGIGALHFDNFPHSTPRYRDSVCLATILGSNGVTLPFDSVATFNSGRRVVALNLAKRNLTIVPKEIAYLDSLKTIDISSNLLKTLPGEISRVSPTVTLMVDSNYLCNISDTLKRWIDTHSKDPDWAVSQRSDSLHFCNENTGVYRPFDRVIKPGRSSGITIHRIKGRTFLLNAQNSSKINRVRVLRTKGVCVWQSAASSRTITIDLTNHPKEIYLVHIDADDGSEVKRLAAF